MPRTPYEVLGRVVWKGGKWYLRHRYPRPPKESFVRVAAKRFAAAMLVAAVVAGVRAFVQHRGDHAA